jgi:non-ribosomal peptide synthetase component F
VKTSTSAHPVVDLLDRAAAANAAGIAIETSSESLTYGQLATRVTDAAAHLTVSGVRPGDVVLLLGERRSSFVIALLAIWQAGAVPAPVDAAHPLARLRRYASAAAAAWELAVSPSIATRRLGHPRHDVTGKLSHVLFTSGTTGEPAAVAVSAAPIQAMMAWYRNEFAVTPGDRVAMLAGLGHDPVLRDIIAALLGAATLVVPEPDVLTAPGRLAGFMDAAQPTIMHATPALLEFGLLGQPAAERFASPRLILSGGAPLAAPLAAEVLRRCPSARLLNVYGATETPQVATAYEVLGHENRIPIGTGVAGAVPMLASELPGLGGPADELVVRSPNLALGYLGSDQASERFTSDPLEEPGYRVYRSGDRASREEDGALVLTGRLDRQVSINGYRVALEEIEAAALSHPDVTHAEAGLRKGAFGDTLTVAVELAEPDAVDGASLRRHLRAQLPAHAIPSAIRIGARVLDKNNKSRLASAGDASGR